MPDGCWGAQLGSQLPLGEPDGQHKPIFPLGVQVSIVFLLEGADMGVVCPPLVPLA